VRPNTVRRPRLALGDGAATRVSESGNHGPCSLSQYTAELEEKLDAISSGEMGSLKLARVNP